MNATSRNRLAVSLLSAGLALAAAMPATAAPVSGPGPGRHAMTPEMQERLQAAGAETRPGSSAAFGEFIRAEKARWAKVVRESGEKFD